MAKTMTKMTAKAAAPPPKPTPTKAVTTTAKPKAPSFDATRSPPRTPEGRAERDALNKAPALRNAPPPAETVAQLPAHMQSDVDMGKEQITQADMDIPRLKLMQGTSKELTLYDELRPGHFFHTASETSFDEPFRVVPIFFDRQYILWRPLENGGGIIARAADGVNWSPAGGEFEVTLDRKDGGVKVKWKLAPTVGASGLANWGTMNPDNPNSPPAATLMYNFVLAFPDHPDLMPAVLTFQRSSIKIGRKFMTKLKTVRTPLFGSLFTLSAFDDHNAANQDYKNISLVGAGLVQDPELYQLYKDMYLGLRKSGLGIRDVDTLQEDPEAGGTDDPNAPAY